MRAAALALVAFALAAADAKSLRSHMSRVAREHGPVGAAPVIVDLVARKSTCGPMSFCKCWLDEPHCSGTQEPCDCHVCGAGDFCQFWQSHPTCLSSGDSCAQGIVSTGRTEPDPHLSNTCDFSTLVLTGTEYAHACGGDDLHFCSGRCKRAVRSLQSTYGCAAAARLHGSGLEHVIDSLYGPRCAKFPADYELPDPSATGATGAASQTQPEPAPESPEDRIRRELQRRVEQLERLHPTVNEDEKLHRPAAPEAVGQEQAAADEHAATAASEDLRGGDEEEEQKEVEVEQEEKKSDAQEDAKQEEEKEEGSQENEETSEEAAKETKEGEETKEEGETKEEEATKEEEETKKEEETKEKEETKDVNEERPKHAPKPAAKHGKSSKTIKASAAQNTDARTQQASSQLHDQDADEHTHGVKRHTWRWRHTQGDAEREDGSRRVEEQAKKEEEAEKKVEAEEQAVKVKENEERLKAREAWLKEMLEEEEKERKLMTA